MFSRPIPGLPLSEKTAILSLFAGLFGHKKTAGLPRQKTNERGHYIMEIIRGLPEKEYRARPEKSQSDFKMFRVPTPAHALHKMSEEREEKDNLLNGTCLHALALEGKTIYEISPTCKTQKNPPQPESGFLLSAHN